MTKNNISKVLENSEIHLTEETNTEDVSKIYGDILGSIIEQSIPKSITSQICSVQPISHEGESVIGIRRVIDEDKINSKVKKAKIKYTYEVKYKGAYSVEASMDLKSIVGSTDFEVFKNAVSGVISEDIDFKIIPVIRNLAKSAGSITLDSSISDASSKIMYGINVGVANINSKIKRGSKSFAILSPTLGAVITGATQVQDPLINAKNIQTNNNNPYFIGRAGKVDLYVDPMAVADHAIVGYYNTGIGETGVIFSPYKFAIYRAVDPDTGDNVYFANMRYGYARNPLDTGTSNGDSDYFEIIEFDTSNLPIKPDSAVSDYSKDTYTATDNQTDFITSGNGDYINVFVEGELYRKSEYTYDKTTKKVILKTGVPAGTSVVIETFNIA